MGCIKGLSWLNVIKYINNHFTKEDLERVKNQLDPADREKLFSKEIFEMSWVDMGAYVRFSNLADKVLGNGDNELIKSIEHTAANDQLKGIYRVILPLFSWKFVIKKVGSMWRTYFNAGTMVVESESPTSIVLKMTGFPDMPEGHEKFQEYYLEELMRLCGIKNPISSHPKCLARGDECCIYHYTFDDHSE